MTLCSNSNLIRICKNVILSPTVLPSIVKTIFNITSHIANIYYISSKFNKVGVPGTVITGLYANSSS